MKLYLLNSVLLLVSLASAHPSSPPSTTVSPSPSTPGHESPRLVSKMLFSDYHFILEGFNVDNFWFEIFRNGYYPPYFLHIVTTKFDWDIKGNKYVILHKNLTDLLGPTSGFALETYPSPPGYRPDEKLCLQRTSAHLRELIKKCFANIALRGLTQTEKQQLEELKRQSNGTKSFKVVYDKKKLKAQFVGYRIFEFEDFKRSGGSDFKVSSNIFDRDSRHMQLHGPIADKSFVIESLPDDSKIYCKNTGLVDLKPGSCSGKVQLRAMSADD